MTIKYSDQFMSWLKEFGYTHCFYVAGGNVMHLLEAASHIFVCVPFVHEAGAAIATDYFNESSINRKKAFLLVTAGPGLTNAITGIAGAWTESRELLVIGGQAKSTEIGRGKYRQIGFQEIDGVTLCKSITKASLRIENKLSKNELFGIVEKTWSDRKGPVFLEFCLDVSLQNGYEFEELIVKKSTIQNFIISNMDAKLISDEIKKSERPVILIGGGISRGTSLEGLIKHGLPIATTFNGIDRIGCEYEFYAGHPNWYGARWANLIIQQSDLIIALGTRLGIMQVGYNWQSFAPQAKIVQVELDDDELNKGFPKLFKGIRADANSAISEVSKLLRDSRINISEWQNFISMVRRDLSGPEEVNTAEKPYLEAMKFVSSIISLSTSTDILIPCSSGAAGYEGAMRVILNKTGQKVITSNALASMGYGLPGAIGASLANVKRRTILFEGDGGFAQNSQELGTAKINNLNLKIFIMDNQGYQSIRNNQKTSFNGHYVGCDRETGLFLPDWIALSKSFDIETMELNSETFPGKQFDNLFCQEGPAVFVVRIDPNQSYWPRILSSRDETGNLVSNPIHKMHPPLNAEHEKKYLPFL